MSLTEPAQPLRSSRLLILVTLARTWNPLYQDGQFSTDKLTMSEDPEKTALTLANLASCASSTLDKTRFVNTYILSQKTYLAAYAAEPRAASSFSNSPPPAAASLSPSRRNIESGFDTPVLKARVPAQHAKDASGKTDCIHTTNHVEESDSNAEDEGDPPSRTRTVRQPTQALQLPKPSRATTKRQSKLNPLQPRPLNQAVPSKRDAYSTTKMKVPPKKRKRSPSTDDERIARKSFLPFIQFLTLSLSFHHF